MKIKDMVAVVGVAGLLLGVSAGEVGKSTPRGFTDDFAAAKSEAVKAKKNIVAVFSGSDWCHWCKVLEKDYLSKSEFVEEAKKDFVLVFVDNPRDKSVLSETARANNGKLTEQYGIQGFPTVKILDADGKEITDLRPANGASPKEYAEALRQEVKCGPLLKQYVKPFQDETDALMKEYRMNLQTKQAELSKTKSGEDLEKATFEEMKQASVACLAKVKAIKARAEASKAPAEIAAQKAKVVRKLGEMLTGLDRVAKLTWDDVKKLREEFEKNRGKRAK